MEGDGGMATDVRGDDSGTIVTGSARWAMEDLQRLRTCTGDAVHGLVKFHTSKNILEVGEHACGLPAPGVTSKHLLLC
jgi:hypothetical protein